MFYVGRDKFIKRLDAIGNFVVTDEVRLGYDGSSHIWILSFCLCFE